MEASLVAVLTSFTGNVLNLLMGAVGEVARVALSSAGVSWGHCDVLFLVLVESCESIDGFRCLDDSGRRSDLLCLCLWKPNRRAQSSASFYVFCL